MMFRSRNEKSYAKMKMKDFPAEMFRMSNGLIVDFEKTPCFEDPMRFDDYAVEEAAEILNVKPTDIADRNGWKNLGDMTYDIYDNGVLIRNGGWDLYYDKETVEHFCNRNKRDFCFAAPVQMVPENVASELRDW